MRTAATMFRRTGEAVRCGIVRHTGCGECELCGSVALRFARCVSRSLAHNPAVARHRSVSSPQGTRYVDCQPAALKPNLNQCLVG
jgi:hypothetical protein